jgi:hypothetical protein
VKRAVLILLVAAGCLGGEHRDARDKYNDGVTALGSGDLDGAEKALLEARSSAGVDPELRFRAAFDLGAAYAAQAEKLRAGQDEDLDKALDLEQNAVSWFSDALRQRPGDADATANLAIVRARAQSIGDDLRKGANKLDARLDAVIADQRGVLDEGRLAWLQIKQTGGADPLAQQSALTHLADRERGIVAEAGVIGDLASDEIDSIGKKKEEARTPEEKVRVVQLKNLDLYLLDGRSKVAEARRKLQELAAQDGVDRAEAAVVALTRAREQLLDPIQAMQRIAGDETDVTKETMLVGKGSGGIGDAVSKLDIAWLQPAALAARQGGIRDRLEEVRARLQAGADAPPPDAGSANDPKAAQQAAQEAKLMEKVKAALPLVGAASAAMDRARLALGDAKYDDGAAGEREALARLAEAIEVFSDLRQTIELAYQHSQRTLAVLAPEARKELAAAERAQQTRDEVAGNIARVEHIKEQIAEQLEELPPDAGSATGSGSAVDPKAAQAAQMREMLSRAEQLRGETATALAATEKALGSGGDPTAPAKDADAKLSELRQLFFSVVEHLKQLIREQGETRDKTSSANGQPDADRAPLLPELLGKQSEHTQMAKAITQALAKQADEAGKQPQGHGPPQPGEPSARTLSQAADEVRLASGDMADAESNITAAKDATNRSVSLDPVVASQAKALEHLQNALKLLEPPQHKKNDDDKKNQQQQQQQQQQPQGGAGQRARDDDARRQRERAQRGSASDPVDKDW